MGCEGTLNSFQVWIGSHISFVVVTVRTHLKQRTESNTHIGGHMRLEQLFGEDPRDTEGLYWKVQVFYTQRGLKGRF